MHFTHPHDLFLIWIAPVVVGLVLWGQRRLRRRCAVLFEAAVFDRMVGGGSRLNLGMGPARTGLIIGLLVTALAGPRWRYAWTDATGRGLDLVVAVDLSKSMLATDVRPSRLEAAKRELKDLLAKLEGDRVGLVAFAGQAFLQCPLTADYEVARMFLDLMDPQMMTRGGTNISDAIAVSLETLKNASQAGTGKAILLITDGEDQGTQARDLASQAKEQGIRIYALGIGRIEGAPIPTYDGGFQKDAQGKTILTRLDQELLQSLAQTTEGHFTLSDPSDVDLDQLYHQGIAKLAKTSQDMEKGRVKDWQDDFQWPLAFAMILLALPASGMTRRLGRGRP